MLRQADSKQASEQAGKRGWEACWQLAHG